jgi:hypothetical protein
MSGRGTGAAATLCMLCACTLAPAPAEPAPGTEALPSGYGTLRQEDVSITMLAGDLQLMVTPLHQSVLRVTAPDTERRLSALVDAHAASGATDGTGLFLVSFFSDRADIRFVPEDVQLISKGFRLRPIEVIPLTPTWGERRLRQREQATAIYRFPGTVDLESDLVVAYGSQETSQWAAILSRVQAERGRVRARSGIGRGASQAGPRGHP